MAKEPFTHHIESIFSAIEFGIDGLLDKDNSFKETDFVQLTPLDQIDPDRFNRCEVSIDGEKYRISVFRPANPDGLIDVSPAEAASPTDTPPGFLAP